MAYSRRKYARRPARKYPTKRRSAPRRSYAKKRPSRRPMTKRRILNVTSRKKQDNMLAYTNVTVANPSGGTTFAAGSSTLIGSYQNYVIPFICTYRSLYENAASAPGLTVDASTRTATTCFMRGYKERITIQTNDGTPWLWRRVVFTMKGPYFITQQTSSFALAQQTSNGIVRNVNSIPAGSTFATFIALLFKGKEGVDFAGGDYFGATVDRTNVSVLSDKTRTLASGNEDGMIREFKIWQPFNKNLVYADDEDGGTVDSNGFSSTSKQGMGDCYVVDIFRARVSSASSSQLSFNPHGTLYWHEK
ncbi:capsid protein [Plant associated genomovirus 21]|uniref:Capsid protein n=1 Tax=Plant associated genomovirus 21 TaxID=2584393 RepID=A0A4Y5QCP2_9VIRU|nr:capsid protein [Plant associated genomovirus 21]QCX29510.1 capsid protein [Plant associated genomovirus 21]